MEGETSSGSKLPVMPSAGLGSQEEIKVLDEQEIVADKNVQVAGAVSQKLKDEKDGASTEPIYSKSVITDPKKERKYVFMVSFAAFAAAASYIVMVFIAFPLSIHTIINGEDGCDPDVDDTCFAPTERSQDQYTLALTLLRVATFLMGSFVGTLSDKYGRKPLLVGALLGYTGAAIFFLAGWGARNVNLFFAGAVLLGASSPVLPHGIAYISDISMPSRLAPNLGVLQGVGYFGGLMTGALISLGIAAITVGGEDDNVESYENLFNGSYSCGLLLSASAAAIVFLFVPESLHPDNRVPSLDLKKANPLGFVVLLVRAPYFFAIFFSSFMAWMSVGASESVHGGWWLRRYAVADTNVFVLYLVFVWVASALGAVIMTRVYVALMGLKPTLHVTMILTITTGVYAAFAPTVLLSYIVVPLFFVSSSVVPALMAVLMGQVDSHEKGTMAGAYRSAEALGKLIGIAIFGSLFADYIAPFTPDISCVPDVYDTGFNNDCDCGVRTCPDLVNVNGTITQVWVPNECSLGNLNQKVKGIPSKFVDNSTRDLPYSVVPQLFVDIGEVQRTDDCLGAGFAEGVGGLTSANDRVYCITEDGLSEAWNQEVGCPGFDILRFGADAAFLTCDSLGEPNASLGCTEEQYNFFFDEDGNTTYVPYHDLTRFAEFAGIANRVLSGSDEPNCEDSGSADYNVCLVGETITDTPFIFPLFYYGVLGALSYLGFIIGEVFFSDSDQKYWKEREMDVIEEDIDREG